MILKDSQPHFKYNKIAWNECVGIFIRDKSHGEIEENLVI